MSAVRPSVAFLALAAGLAFAAAAPAGAQLPGCQDGSVGLVLSVTPASHSATISRGGSSAPLGDLTMLCAGDLISLGSGESAFIEIQGSPASTVAGPTSYSVSGGAGMAGNAAIAVAGLLFPDSSNRTRTLVSRSDGAAMSPRPDNLGARLPQQLAASDAPRDLWFGWTGGAAPFHVTLEDSAGDALASADIGAEAAAAIRAAHTSSEGVVAAVPYDVVFHGVTLAPGEYKIRVADANSEPADVAALMSDADAGVMSMPIVVDAALAGVPGDGASDLERIVEATCFSVKEPENRLYEAAQHIVQGRDAAPYATSLALLGSDLTIDPAACP